jgi:hypothetical protein
MRPFIKGRWKLVGSFNMEEEVKTFDYMREAIRPFERGLAEAPHE